MYRNVYLLTNNPMVKNKLSNLVFKFIEGNTIDVYKEARDMIHKNYILLTHPLTSSLKPNETPYRTVAISIKPGEALHIDSLIYIHNAIEVTEKFLKIRPIGNLSDEILNDFQVIDFSIIENAIKK